MSDVVVPVEGAVEQVLVSAVDSLSDEGLRRHIAASAGLLAHRRGINHAFKVLCTIAGALGQKGGRA